MEKFKSLKEDLDTLEKALKCRQSDIVKAQDTGREYFMKLLGDLQEAQKDSELIKNALVKIKQYPDLLLMIEPILSLVTSVQFFLLLL